MVNLKLKLKPDDIKVIARSKKSLIKQFKLSSYEQIDKAVWLALYLYVSGNVEEAKVLLESFVSSEDYTENTMLGIV